MEEISLFNKFFFDCRYVPQLRRYSPTNLYDGTQMAIFGDFLRPVFSVSRVQHVLGEEKKKKKKPKGKNIMSASATQGGHKNRLAQKITSES